MPLSKNKIKLSLESFVKKHSEIKLLGYFGSYAKGTAKLDSDIDICISLGFPISIETRINYMGEMSLLLKKEVDLVDLSDVSGVILREALLNSEWIIRDVETHATIVKKMLFDQADFQPLYDQMLKVKRERFLKS